jgi:hypothetical protein
MKRLLTSLVVLAAVICGSCIHSAAADKAPAIRIVLEHQNNEAVSWLPALDNWGSTEPHTDSFLDGTISHSYKAVATAAGHLSVKAHYILTQNGVKTVVDKQLRVFEKKPEPGQWTQLSKGWNAYAYLAEYTQ